MQAHLEIFRVNSYVLVSCDNGYLVGQIEWLAVEHSPYPKQRDIQDFGLVNLPFPRKNKFKSVGTLKRFSKDGTDYFKFQRGSESFLLLVQLFYYQQIYSLDQLSSLVIIGE
jgi:hypothetical protein